MSERSKPLLTVRDRDVYLSVWLSSNAFKIRVSRKTEKGFEAIGNFMIPLDFLLFKVIDSVQGREVYKRYCSIAEALEVEEEEEKSS